MGDMGEVFAGMNQATQARHRTWKEDNTRILEAGPYTFTVANRGESLLFREPGRPKVDFFPSTGRWRVAGVRRTFSGGAEKFLSWYQYYCDPNNTSGQTRLRKPPTKQKQKETKP